jgi:hypothetical protein
MLLLKSANSILFNAIIPNSPVSGTKLDIAYLEYVNGDAVEPPEIKPDESEDYYVSLKDTQDRDYLRVPILSHKVGTNSNGKTVLTIIVESSGDTGVHGTPFSAAAGSRIYGIAIAASQTNDRPDLLFSRHYYPESGQYVKPESGAIMLSIDFV